MDFDSISAGLRALETEYADVLKAGGDVRSMIVNPETAGVMPSPQLHACSRTWWSLRSAFVREAFLPESLPTTRLMIAEFLWPFCGKLDVPAVPADEMLTKRGVGGYFISWPGVDVSPSAPTLLYFHGGAMIAGTALCCGAFLSRLSRAANMRVLTVEYPLCPEVSAAEATESGVQAYRYLIEDLGVKPKQVFMNGESGGGQIMLLILQSIVNQRLPTPAAAWAVSPGTRTDEGVLTQRSLVKNDILVASPLRLVFDLLRQAGTPSELPLGHPSSSPYHGLVVGLPPIFFTWGAVEMLAKETEQMADKVAAAGVPVGRQVSDRGPHAFPLLNTPESAEAITLAVKWMEQFRE